MTNRATKCRVVYLLAADNYPTPKPAPMPSYHTHVRGPYHDVAPCLLPTRHPGLPVTVCYAARCLAQPMRDDTGNASQAYHAAASTLQGAHAVYRLHPQASLYPV